MSRNAIKNETPGSFKYYQNFWQRVKNNDLNAIETLNEIRIFIDYINKVINKKNSLTATS